MIAGFTRGVASIQINVTPPFGPFVERMNRDALRLFFQTAKEGLEAIANDMVNDIKRAIAPRRYTGQLQESIGYELLPGWDSPSPAPRTWISIGPNQPFTAVQPERGRHPAQYFTPLEFGSRPARGYSSMARKRITTWAVARGIPIERARFVYASIVHRGTRPANIITPVVEKYLPRVSSYLEERFDRYVVTLDP